MDEFPEEISQVATSLSIHAGHTVNRAEVICRCMKYFEQYYEAFAAAGNLSGLKNIYNEMLVNRDAEVRVLEPGNEYTGISRGINDLGELLVEREDHSVTAVFAGEVSVRGVYGYT